jgi:hypothetical protein
VSELRNRGNWFLVCKGPSNGKTAEDKSRTMAHDKRKIFIGLFMSI